MKGLSDCGAHLSKAVKDLQMSWDAAASLWRDEAQAHFQETYLEELTHQAKSTAGAMDHISALLREAIARCR